MMEYTEGKWELKQPASGQIIVVAGDFTIAKLECYGPIQRLHETVGNAHLISATLDMYKALKNLLNTGICDICYEDDCGGEFACTKGKYGEPCNCHKAKAKAEKDCYKALAKAEGK